MADTLDARLLTAGGYSLAAALAGEDTLRWLLLVTVVAVVGDSGRLLYVVVPLAGSLLTLPLLCTFPLPPPHWLRCC